MMSEEQAITKQTRNPKKALLTASAILIAILLVVCGFAGWQYLFPSDKTLFVMAHYNSIKDQSRTKNPDMFYKTTDVTCNLTGAFVLPETMKSVNAMSIHTENAHLKDGNGFFRLSCLFDKNSLLHVETVHYDGVSYISSPELTDGTTYSGTSTQEMLNILLGGQGVTTDVGLLDGVDKKMFKKYLADYGKKLYRALPDSAFSCTTTEEGTEITLFGNAAWLLTDTITELRNDYGLKNFLYAQREQIVKNIHTAYSGATLLVADMTQAEFEIAYDEALDQFLQDISENETTIRLTTNIDKKRRVISDTLLLKQGETVLFDAFVNQTGSYRFVPYTDGVPIFTVKNEKTVSKTVTDSVLTVSMDVNDFSKSPSLTEQKLVTLTAKSKLDTDMKAHTVHSPQHHTNLAALSDSEKQEISAKTDQNIMGILTTLMLSVFGID